MPASLTVTVVVSPGLQAAVDGRPKLLFGLPPGAGLGELWETLLKLYPKLSARIADERSARPGLQAALEGDALGERRGFRLYLFAPGIRESERLG